MHAHPSSNGNHLLAIGFAIFLAAMVFLGHPATGQTTFDGDWSATAVSETGMCKPSQDHLVRIRNGRALDRHSRRYEVNGGLDGSGNIDGSVRVRNTTIIVTGRIDKNVATGTWRSTGRRVCAGRWKAERRG